jgi:uncharacterized protein
VNVTADANIYVSAFNFGGPAQRLLDLADAGAIHLAISEDIIEEVLDVLGRKFDWSAPELRLARDRMSRVAKIVHPTDEIVEVTEDPDDDRILECAVASKSEVIVTGDRDLLRRTCYRDIRIVKVADFLKAWPREAE